MKNFLLNHKKLRVFWLLIFKYSADIQAGRHTTFIYSFIKLDTCYVQGTILESVQKSYKWNKSLFYWSLHSGRGDEQSICKVVVKCYEKEHNTING